MRTAPTPPGCGCSSGCSSLAASATIPLPVAAAATLARAAASLRRAARVKHKADANASSCGGEGGDDCISERAYRPERPRVCRQHLERRQQSSGCAESTRSGGSKVVGVPKALGAEAARSGRAESTGAEAAKKRAYNHSSTDHLRPFHSLRAGERAGEGEGEREGGAAGGLRGAARLLAAPPSPSGSVKRTRAL